MKRQILFSLLLFTFEIATSQTPVYTFISGDSLINKKSNTLKTLIGPRQNAAYWTDSTGNFWLFGGEGYDYTNSTGFFNDLWKYDPREKVWTWMQGRDRINQKPVYIDNALRFDGKNDVIEIDTLKNYRSDFTWEAWIKTTAIDARSIMSFNVSELNCCPDNTDGQFDLIMYNGWLQFNNPIINYGYAGNRQINDGKWHHIAMTVDVNATGNKEELVFYMDGKKEGTHSGNFDEAIDDTDTSDYVTKIGKGRWGTFDGSIDEVKIWSKVLTAEDIVISMSRKATGEESDLVAYYGFDQGYIEGDNLVSNITVKGFGDEVAFAKANFADPNLPANQDQISANVWLTRADTRGLYNAAQESGYTGQWYNSPSPIGTLWAMKPTKDASPGDYVTWTQANEGVPPNMVGQTMSMYIPEENRYFDIMWTSWTSGGGGGGFSYTRKEIIDVPFPYDSLLDKGPGAFHGTLLNFSDRAYPFLKGSVADVRVWNTARSQAEIQSSMYQVVGSEPNLEAFYDFSDGVANGENTGLPYLTDQTGHGHNGTFYGLALSGSNSNYSNDDFPSKSILNPEFKVNYSQNEFGNYPVVSLFGGATPGGYSLDSDMTLVDETGVDQHTWITTIYLTVDNLRFRANHSSSITWGSYDYYLGGVARSEAWDIFIDTEGWYKVTFNDETGEFSFVPQPATVFLSVGIIGPATAVGDWFTDVDLTQDVGNAHIWRGNITLTSGEVKFRAEDSWAVNWGAFSFPSGRGYQDGPNISVTAGTYDIYFNDITGEYAFQSDANVYSTVGLFGTATSGGLSYDIDLIQNPNNPYLYSNFITLNDGDAIFRADDNSTVNWASSDFPDGIGTAGGANIPISSSRYFVQFNSGTGEYLFTKTALFSEKIATGDFNGDGWPDLVSADYLGHRITVFLSDGAGNFYDSDQEIVPGRPYDLVIGDFNSDTYADVISVNETTGNISVMLGDGSGNLASPVNYAVGNGPEGIDAGDFNGDTILDLAITNSADATVSILLGVGDGTFGTQTTFSTGGQSYGIRIADLDKDTYNDLAIANFDGFVSVLLGNGDGTFNGYVPYGTSYSTHTIAIADMNGDTNLDIVAGNLYVQSVSVLINDGTAYFGTTNSFYTLIDPDGLAVADLDLDGNLDVSVGRQKLMVLSGDGTGLLSDPKYLDNLVNRYIIDVISGDFNADGKADLAYAANTGEIKIFINNNNFVSNHNTLAMDGLQDYVEINNIDVYNSNFTVEAWVNTTEDGTIFSLSPQNNEENWGDLQSGFSIFIYSGYLNVNIPWANSPWYVYPNLNDGQWHHIAVTVEYNYDGYREKVSLFVDGTFVGSTSDSELDGTLISAPGGLVTKIGYTVNNFPPVQIGSGGLIAGSKSNWVNGIFPSTIGGRSRAASLTDSKSNFWLFGGFGIDSLGNLKFLNNLSRLDVQNQEWVSVSGSGTGNIAGVYGTLGIEDVANAPGSRNYSRGWVDEDDNLWIFGGYGYDENGTESHLNDIWKFDTQSSLWTWVKGDKTVNTSGTYGTIGISDASNTPGARANQSTWKDLNGDFWMFGGYGLDASITKGYLNDLWKFDHTNLTWTWISGTTEIDKPGIYGVMGIPDPGNYPGGRSGSTVWVDDNNKFWFFGGEGADKYAIEAGQLSDLWMYDPDSGMWTWMGGLNFKDNTGSYGDLGVASAENLPGARWNASSFKDDQGNLWMFGGYKATQGKAGTYNDTWKFDINSNQWTWLGGINQTADIYTHGTYGTLSDGSKQYPGARNGALAWNDQNGNFWVMGGNLNAAGGSGMLNDLWKYEPRNDIWTYITGSTELDQTSGNYGTKGFGNSTNVPPPRWHAANWTGPNGKLWFFGGISPFGDGANIGWRNDLWNYDPESGFFTWMSGSSNLDPDGIYGAKGVPSVNKIPGARSSAANWVDKDGMLWLFGGYESFEYYNDLWKYNPYTNEWTWVSGRNSQNIPGNYGTKGVPDVDNEIGSRRYMSGWIDLDGNFWVFGGQGIDGQGSLTMLNDLWRYEPSTNEWTWMSGSETGYGAGHYGTKGVPGPDNVPPPRYGFSNWTDASGNLWLYGGVNVSNQLGWYNDLWKYDVVTNEWTWIGGDDFEQLTLDDESIRGEKGVGSINNLIGARERAASAPGYDENFLLFSGRRNGNYNYSDLWDIRFIPGIPRIEYPHAISQTSFDFAYDEAWAEEFKIELTSDPLFANILQNAIGTPADTIEISSLNPGTTYYYRMQAINRLGVSDYSDTVQVLTLPATPQFTAGGEISSLTQTSVTINWDPVPEILDGYLLDISTDSSFIDESKFLVGYVAKDISKSLTSETINNLDPGSQYYARVRSYNATGESPSSENLEILTTPATPGTATVSVTGIAQKSATIHWQTVPEILDNYLLEVSTDNTFSDNAQVLSNYNLLNLPKVTLSKEITGLTPGTLYYARIYAANSSGNSLPSGTITILTLPETPLFSGADFLTGITQTEARLKWTTVPEILDGYEMEVSTDFNFTSSNFFLPDYGLGDVPKVLTKDSTTHTLTILFPGVSYYVRVRSFNSSGASPNSNVITINTIPSAPVINPVTNIEQTAATLTWSQVTGATSYILDVTTDSTFNELITHEWVKEDFPVAVPFESLTGLIPGETYYVRIQSANVNGSSGHVANPDYGYANFITVPAAPFIEDPLEIQQTSSTLVWQSILGADSYELDVSNNGFQTYLTNYSSKPITDTTEVITGLDPGKIHQVRIRSVNSSGTSNNSSVLLVLAVPPTPIARDASSKTSNSFKANWDPVAGATYYVLEVSLDGFVTFVHQEIHVTSNPVDIAGLTENIDYEYRVRAGNESGESPNSNVIIARTSNAAQPLSFATINYGATFDRGLTQSIIKITTSGGLADPAVKLRYKGILASAWSPDSVLSQNDNGEFTFTVTPSLLDIVGFQFEVSATDGFSTVKNIDNFIYWSFNDVQSDTIPLTKFGGNSSSWQIFSIPYKLDDNLIETIFNETGALKYKVDWRLVHYQNTGDDQSRYVDAGEGINRIELGKGYWFNAKEKVKINIGAGEINDEIPFPLSLVQGWNQIGNPYNVPISWNSVIASNNVIGIVEFVQLYDQEQNSFAEGDEIVPFSGGFVWADETKTLNISPVDNLSGGRIEASVVKGSDLDSDEWMLDLGIRNDIGEKIIGGIGMHPEASWLKDKYDRMTLPRFLDYTEIYSSHEEYFYPWFSVDVLPTAEELHWKYTLASNQPGNAGEIFWDNRNLGSRMAQLWLLDRNSGHLINMKSSNSYRLALREGSASFDIYYLKNPDAQLQIDALILGDAYPNPASTQAAIPVILPDYRQTSDIDLSIYDINGKKIATLASGEFAAGYHEFKWDLKNNENINPGLYIYRLVIRDGTGSVLQKKIIVR